MFWPKKVATVAEKSAPSPQQKDIRPKQRKVEPAGHPDEVKSYVALCQKIHAETPAVRMLQLRQFLVERGIPEYEVSQVHQYLRGLVAKIGNYVCYTWKPLREEDKNTRFRWWWGGGNRCELSDTLYHKLVPHSVLQTVAIILEALPDAKFFVSHISEVKDPFLLVTFTDVDPVVVDFWNEPGFRPE